MIKVKHLVHECICGDENCQGIKFYDYPDKQTGVIQVSAYVCVHGGTFTREFVYEDEE